MNIKSLIVSSALFAAMHVLVWFSNNAQLAPRFKGHAMALCIALAIPCSLVAYYAVQHGYEAFGNAWSVRLLGFGVSYLVFPAMAWFMLGESPLNAKTGISILLSFVIVAVQLWWPK